jgi:hypothetical protein
MPLCKPSRNPDGSFVWPDAYEINAAIVFKLFLGAIALFMILLVVSLIAYRLRRQRSSLWLVGIGTLLMAFHPIWTVGTSGGDCGIFQVWCSWMVLGPEGMLLIGQLLLSLWRSTDSHQLKDYDDAFRPEPPSSLR